MEKITDLDRHRVMLKHAKVKNWILWNIRMDQWTERHWKDFESVKAGNKPTLIKKDSRGDLATGRIKIQYIAYNEHEKFYGDCDEIAYILGCSPDTIRARQKDKNKIKNFKIVKL